MRNKLRGRGGGGVRSGAHARKKTVYWFFSSSFSSFLFSLQRTSLAGLHDNFGLSAKMTSCYVQKNGSLGKFSVVGFSLSRRPILGAFVRQQELECVANQKKLLRMMRQNPQSYLTLGATG